MQTPIDPEVQVRCKCGVWCTYNTITDRNRRGGNACHKCKSRMLIGRGRVSTLKLLRAFGIQVRLDWDDSIILEHDDEIPEAVAEFVTIHQKAIRGSIHDSVMESQMIFVGGPLNAQQHDFGRRGYYVGQRLCMRIDRGKWAAYVHRDYRDPRVYFIGMATSEAKAKKLPLPAEKVSD